MDKAWNAIQAVLHNPTIGAYLRDHDPKLLEQLEDAREELEDLMLHQRFFGYGNVGCSEDFKIGGTD